MHPPEPNWAPPNPSWPAPSPYPPPAQQYPHPRQPHPQTWSAPDPNWAPPGVQPRTRVHRPWTVLLVALVALTTFGIAILAAAPPPGLPGGNAASLIGADGHVEVQETDGLFTHVEWAHLDGPRVFSGPFAFYWVINDMELDEAITTMWIRHTRTTMLGGQTYRLFSLDDAGLRLRVTTEDDGVTHYFPGRLDLPADVAAGQEWVSEGTVTTDQIHEPYRANGRATDAPEVGENCLRVELDETIGANPLVTHSGIWCPERGLVVDGPWTPGELEAAPRGSAELAWHPETWTMHEPEPMQVTGGAPLVVTPISAPLGVAGRSLAIGTSQDVVTFDNTWLINGVSHSGGQLTAAAQAGDLTLTATSHRTITATDPRNWRRWQIPTSDVAQQLVPSGPDHFVSVDFSGTIALHGLDDGAELWTAAYPGAGELPLVVAGDHLYLASGSEEVTVLELATGKPVATVAVPDSIRTLGGAPGTLVIYGFSGRVWAYDPDGTQRWVTPLQDGSGGGHIAVTDTEVVVGGDFALRGLSLQTGAVQWWNAEPTEQLITDGQTVLVYSDSHVAVYRDGSLLHHWPRPNPYLVSDYFCRALTDGVTCINGNGEIVEVRP